MLTIRLQRTGRSGHAHFRLVVQDSRFSPTSGRVVANLGSYNPHNKELNIDTEKAAGYLKNGAQPSDRAARLLKQAGVKLPKWVVTDDKKKGDIRNPEKLRRNRPVGEPARVAEVTEEKAVADLPTEAPAEEGEAPAEEEVVEVPAETAVDLSAEASA